MHIHSDFILHEWVLDILILITMNLSQYFASFHYKVIRAT